MTDDQNLSYSDTQQAYNFLKTLSLFEGLRETNIVAMADGSRFLHVPQGNYIFFQSDPGDSLFLMCKGIAAVVLISTDGRELLINEVHQGDCFGEVSLLSGRQRTAGAVAKENSVLVEIPGATFLPVFDSEPLLIRRMLEITIQRLYATQSREGALAFLDAPARIARILLEIDERDRQGSDKGYLTLSQEELAQRTGLTRQTVARELGNWRRKGWLLTGRGRIMLLDRKALREILSPSLG